MNTKDLLVGVCLGVLLTISVIVLYILAVEEAAKKRYRSLKEHQTALERDIIPRYPKRPLPHPYDHETEVEGSSVGRG